VVIRFSRLLSPGGFSFFEGSTVEFSPVTYTIPLLPYLNPYFRVGGFRGSPIRRISELLLPCGSAINRFVWGGDSRHLEFSDLVAFFPSFLFPFTMFSVDSFFSHIFSLIPMFQMVLLIFPLWAICVFRFPS